MEELEQVLERNNIDRKILLIIRVYIDRGMSVNAFIDEFNCRKILKFHNFGLPRLLKLAECLDKEGFSLKF